jgi:hypothetical protein
MISSADGCLHLSRCTTSPDGDRAKWSALYEQIHQVFQGDATPDLAGALDIIGRELGIKRLLFKSVVSTNSTKRAPARAIVRL